MSPRDSRKFQSSWWTIDIPLNMGVTEDSHCVTFSGGALPGVLQISAARKQDAPVSDGDLKHFAGDAARLAKPLALKGTSFTGIYAEQAVSSVFHHKWWLRSGFLMLYCSYTTNSSIGVEERTLVGNILTTLGTTDG